MNDAQSANTTWYYLLNKILEEGSDVSPRGLLCKEILSHTTRINMKYPVVSSRPKLGYKFLVAEAWWILSGRNDVASIKPYSPHIAGFSNDGLRFDGSYGPRIIDQLRFVCDTLIADVESRQAVIEIWRPNPRPSKDIPCTVAVQWMIRKETMPNDKETFKLHCFDTMRSSDAWLGWPYDVFNFSMLSLYIGLMLRDRDRENGARIGGCQRQEFTSLELGTLHLTAASQHLYVNPLANGATNIPYCLEDVERRAHAGLITGQGLPVNPGPVRLDRFASSESFIRELEQLKDRADLSKTLAPWLEEPLK